MKPIVCICSLLLLFACKKNKDTNTTYPPGTDTVLISNAAYYYGDTASAPFVSKDLVKYGADGLTISQIVSESKGEEITSWLFSYSKTNKLKKILIRNSNVPIINFDYNFYYNNNDLPDSLQIINNYNVDTSYLVIDNESHTVSSYKRERKTAPYNKYQTTFFYSNNITGKLDSIRSEAYNTDGSLAARASAIYNEPEKADSFINFQPAYLFILASRTNRDLLYATNLNPFFIQMLYPGENVFRKGKVDYISSWGINDTQAPFGFVYTKNADQWMDYFEFNEVRGSATNTVSIKLEATRIK